MFIIGKFKSKFRLQKCNHFVLVLMYLSFAPQVLIAYVCITILVTIMFPEAHFTKMDKF